MRKVRYLLPVAALLIVGSGGLDDARSASAQAALPAVSTDRTGYLAGAPVLIAGAGFQAGEQVTLQVSHVTGGAECPFGHAAWTAQADATGGFGAAWTIDPADVAGAEFVLTATAQAGTIQTGFTRIATLQTDKFDYRPGDTAVIAGAGFMPGESVTFQVAHVNGAVGGEGYAPITLTADDTGAVTTFWFVNPNDSLNSILKASAEGATSGLTAVAIFTDPPVRIVDDAGADDFPGQKDLNQLLTDRLHLPISLGISWNWDDTAWSGKNTGDACALFDTNGNGFADYSLCVTVGGSPAVYKSTRLYACGDSRSDRCDQPTTAISPFTSSCSVAVAANSDPFGTAGLYFDPSHVSGNTCSTTAGCYTTDTVAACTADLADFPGATTAFLINVCSYPSQEPNSDPSECVVTPNNGYLTINKVDTETGDTTSFTFQSSAASQDGLTNWTINGTGAVNLISFEPGSYDLSELVPSGWSLDSAACLVNGISTGTFAGEDVVRGVEIRSGQETVCTFTDSRDTGTLKLTKALTGGPENYEGPFTLHYDCGAFGSGDKSVLAGSFETVTGIPTGTSCTVTEPVLPTPPEGYTFDMPTFSPAATVAVDAPGATVEVTTNNTLTRDTGSLELRKSLGGAPDGYTGPFTIHYDCGNGLVGDASVAAGGSASVTGVPTGAWCTVSEPALPSAPDGYSFGTPTFDPAATVLIGTRDATVAVTTTNTLSRDTGSLQVLKTVSNPDGATLPASFRANYNCGPGYAGQVSIAPGNPATVPDIPTGNVCTVSEVAPEPIRGYTWGIVAYSPSSVAIATKGETFTLTVANSITRDRGSLILAKALTGGPDGYSGPFTLHYACGNLAGDVSVAAGGSQTIPDIPTNVACTVSEPTLPTVANYTFGTPTFGPENPVTITERGGAVTVTTSNTLTRDTGSLTITKSVAPSTFAGSFNVHVACTGGGGPYDRTISYPAPGYVTITGIPTGSCVVTETSKPDAVGYTWQAEAITGSPAAITKGGTATVGVANALTARATVVKTQGGSPALTYGFTFQLRQGADSTRLGSVAEQLTAVAGGNVLNFATVLVPGQHYQMCELVMPGWNTNLSGPLFVPGSIVPPALPNPNVDNSPVCTDFVPQPGTTTTFAVDNSYPGGLARTIGFWKNWSSCTGGGQKPVLDQTLATDVVMAARSGWFPAFADRVFVLRDTIPDANIASDCPAAVYLLDKRTLGGKKAASDPAFNLAAQLLAAELNFNAGAFMNGVAINAVNQAVLLLGKYEFTGNGYTGKITAADAATMNALAAMLDKYNNNLPMQ